MIGVPPTGACLTVGIGEFALQHGVDPVACGSIEISGYNNSGQFGADVGLLEFLQGNRNLHAAALPIVMVASPAIAAPKVQVGGGGLQMDIDQLNPSAVWQSDTDLMVAVGEFSWVRDMMLDLAPCDQSTTGKFVVAIVSLTLEECFIELAQAIGMGDLLNEDKIGLVTDDGLREVFVGTGPIDGDNPDYLASFEALGTAGIE